MKHTIIYICLLLPLCLTGRAQSLTVEYNIGHGSYQMSGMKDLLKERVLAMEDALITDKFPGYVTQDSRVGIEWKRHHLGVLFNYMNTAGKKSIADYSGLCSYQLRNKGYKAGVFYRFRLADEKLGIFTFEPYLQLSSGVVLSKVKEEDRLYLYSTDDIGYQRETKYSGTNFFVEPAFGIKFGLCRYVALNLSVGYEWDAVRPKIQTDADNPTPSFRVDWSGYRAQAGLIFYWNLKK